jgi:hypothetical protein
MNHSTDERDEHKLEFHSTSYFGWQSIPVLIIVGIGMIFSIIYALFYSNGKDALAVLIFGSIASLYALYSLGLGVYHYIVDVYDLNIIDGRLVGTGMFGIRQFEMEIRQIKKIKKTWDMEGLDFYDGEGNRVIINGNIDFIGFIYDYILERINPEAEVDWEFIKQKRKNSQY